ncbi:MAG TPA: hypothetical protein VFB29_15355 [Pseudolabrys sp.]|nr:hypothetical protein [Pseudolabrys sp.]
MKRLILGATALAILAAPAFAQKKDDEPLAILEREKKQQAEQVDQQYQRTINRTRRETDSASARTDPWANMRSPTDGKR